MSPHTALAAISQAQEALAQAYVAIQHMLPADDGMQWRSETVGRDGVRRFNEAGRQKIAELLREGKTDSEIAFIMKVDPATAYYHRKRMS